jgi:hypothetical protein
MRSALSRHLEKKSGPRLTNSPPKQALPLVQLCMEYEYLVKAILGLAWAVAVVIG